MKPMAETIGEPTILAGFNAVHADAAMKPMAETIGESGCGVGQNPEQHAAMKPMAETIGEAILSSGLGERSRRPQ